MRNAVRCAQDLREAFGLSGTEFADISVVEQVYPIIITPYYLSLVNRADESDPVWRQAVPAADEISRAQNLEEDPLAEEAHSPVEGLIHRYPDRALILATHLCPVYCRHCFRKRLFRVDEPGELHPNFEKMMAYVRETGQIREVILSGGDPLMLSDRRLEFLLSALRAIPHIEVIRIHTRIPVTLPQRLFSPRILRILRKCSPIWMVTHFNHPNELTSEGARAMDLTLRAGVPINNQTVLLKGVNDDADTMRDLFRGLLRMKCRPYYLHHCDPVRGAGHFRTSVRRGLEILETFRGRVSGLAIPTYVLDAPGGFGKIPVAPNDVVSEAEDHLLLRTPEGRVIRYEMPTDGSSQDEPDVGRRSPRAGYLRQTERFPIE
jgi:lysine 2,3-aminomutase